MNWKLLVFILLTIGFAYRMVLHAVSRRSAQNPTPANVADVYDAETYTRWKAYMAEKNRLQLFSTTLSYVVSLALLFSGAYAAFAGLFPANGFMQLLSVILLETLADTVTGLGLSWVDTMVIEQKYGFNRTTAKTFVIDQIRNFIIGLLLSTLLASLLMWLHTAMGDWVILLFAGVVFLITLAISFLYGPVFSRLGNKFEPLEEGELKEKLMALLTKHGYQVKAIEVMDASRRTTKLNAYFTGFGKLKSIVLFDNLVNAMSTDEICAVFAHELGHGLHKDVLKQQILNLGNLLLMAVTVWLCVREPALHQAFGFAGVNYGFAFVLLGIGLSLVQPLTGLAMNAYSRMAEYRADRQAVKEGYGPYLTAGLKKLARENFAHLAPSPVLVALEYSHPPLSQRIEAIEKELKK
ncbi:MAG: M48 family metallopeptidase [Clostridia bacterium]|nr:M48 family metallopeptidase [Clostridia bacterium]